MASIRYFPQNGQFHDPVVPDLHQKETGFDSFYNPGYISNEMYPQTRYTEHTQDHWRGRQASYDSSFDGESSMGYMSVHTLILLFLQFNYHFWKSKINDWSCIRHSLYYNHYHIRYPSDAIWIAFKFELSTSKILLSVTCVTDQLNKKYKFDSVPMCVKAIDFNQ